ncbi:MAG TPA: glycosyltransferase family A protein [Opitutaceae bacterium]|nr:glycosyltransferase family A protein [Opitutaceae bacterium]
MARVRVFIPTYRRGALLQRALESLRRQTWNDWEGVVHNDDPSDPGPAALVASLQDPRLRLHQHRSNLGPVETFNRGFTEPMNGVSYFSILEDDNTWYPHFLETMVGTLEKFPRLSLVWCNQRIWQESPSGEWEDTGTSVHPEGSSLEGSACTEPEIVSWGHFSQAMGARMANGAMVMRVLSQPLRTPNIPFTGMEAVRERAIPHPLLYLPQTLATYSRTHSTARSRDGHTWGALQTLLLATYYRHARFTPENRSRFWEYLRAQTPPPTNLALHAAFSCPGCSSLLQGARLSDWFRYLKTWVGRPRGAWTCVRARAHYSEWWRALDQITAERFAETPSPATAAVKPSS